MADTVVEPELPSSCEDIYLPLRMPFDNHTVLLRYLVHFEHLLVLLLLLLRQEVVYRRLSCWVPSDAQLGKMRASCVVNGTLE